MRAWYERTDWDCSDEGYQVCRAKERAKGNTFGLHVDVLYVPTLTYGHNIWTNYGLRIWSFIILDGWMDGTILLDGFQSIFIRKYNMR